MAAHGSLYWLPLALFLAHIAEEFPNFPAWATRHFGTTSRAWYVYSHILLIALSVAICRWASLSSAQSWGATIGMAFMFTLALNGWFHLKMSIRFQEYSPGVATGVGLIWPATAYMTWVAIQDASLLLEQLALSVAIGAAVQFAVIESLRWDMDVDWRLRLRRG